MKKIYRWAIKRAFLKLDPRQQIKKSVMFVVYSGAIAATVPLLWTILTFHCGLPSRSPTYFGSHCCSQILLKRSRKVIIGKLRQIA